MRECDLNKLSDLYQSKYKRELIGKKLGQFHSDFQSIGDSKEMPIAQNSIFVGKKTYIDQLYDRKEKTKAFHCRAKGIPTDVLVTTANKRYPKLIQCQLKNGLVYPKSDDLGSKSDNEKKCSIFQLYTDLYEGKEVEFNLCEGSAPCFDMKSNFSIETKNKFTRKLKF